MRLSNSWASAQSLWDGLCAAGEYGIARMLGRKLRRPKSTYRRKRSYWPTFEAFERRELPAALTGITEYAITTGSSGALGICTGPDGNIWFTESSANKIAKITPAGTITEYTVPTSSSVPYDIVAGSD